LKKIRIRKYFALSLLKLKRENMKRIIEISEGVIMGQDKLSIVEILPQLETSFRQRKQYFEYYFDGTGIDITLEQIDSLSNIFRIRIGMDTITIEI